MWIGSEVERSTRAPLPPVIRLLGRNPVLIAQRLGGARRLAGSHLSCALRRCCGQHGLRSTERFYSFETSVPTILSAQGYSIVQSFRYSVVIYGAVIPATYSAAMSWNDWTGNMQFCFGLLRYDGVELGSAFRGRLVK
jgi:hypothetical protein